MLAAGKMGKWMGLAKANGTTTKIKLLSFIKVNIKMESKMAMENINGSMARSLEEFGKMVKLRTEQTIHKVKKLKKNFRK